MLLRQNCTETLLDATIPLKYSYLKYVMRRGALNALCLMLNLMLHIFMLENKEKNMNELSTQKMLTQA